MPKNIFNGRRMTDDGKSKYGNDWLGVAVLFV